MFLSSSKLCLGIVSRSAERSSVRCIASSLSYSTRAAAWGSPSYRRSFPLSPVSQVSYSTSTTHPTVQPPPQKHRIFQDEHRLEVFYHLVDPPTPVSVTEESYAVSFVDSLEAPLGNGSRNGMGNEGGNVGTVVGWVPLGKEGRPVWSAFKENPTFKPTLHETIYTALRDGADEVWVNGAKQIGSGWMHLHDQRNPPPLGRIGDPDDILGTVLVEDGVIKADTYQPMPSYRIYTPTDGKEDSIGGYGRELGGFMKLTPGLLERLKQCVRRVGRNEKGQRAL